MTLFSSQSVFRREPTNFGSNGSVAPMFGQVTWPSAVYDAAVNKTWVTWIAWIPNNQRIYYNVYDHTAGTWLGQTFIVTCSFGTSGDHGAPSMLLDDSGYIHIFHSAYNSLIFHRVGNSPHSLTASTSRPTFGAASTYPCPTMVGSTCYLFCQELDGSNFLNWGFYTTTFTGGIESGWSAWTELVHCAAGAERFYAGQPQLFGTKFLFPGTFSSTGVSFARNVYYFIYDTADGSLSNVDSSHVIPAASLPVSKADCDTFFKVITSAINHGGDLPAIGLDTSNNPHVMYTDGVQLSSSFDFWHTAYISGAWTTPQLLGTAVAPYGKCAVVQLPSGAIDCYFEQTSNTGLIGGMGTGNIYKASRSSAGVWAPALPIQLQSYRLTGKIALASISAVKGANSDIRTVWSEECYTVNANPALEPGAGTLRLYAYGDNGFK